jgi:phosphohistidine phosphatase
VKLLSILRHAKSSWKDDALDDHDRPLNKRGTRDAPRMGRLIGAEGLVPDAILCSTARRARDTAMLMAEAAGFPDEVHFTNHLYLAAPSEYLDELRALSEPTPHAMVIGHNPGLEDLLEVLVGESHTLPTAALAVVELPIVAWRDIASRPTGTLRSLWLPKELGGPS